MRARRWAAAAAVACAVLAPGSAGAVGYTSAVPLLGGPPITFEGFAEGALISNQFAGVTFGQVDGGTPMIDNFPMLFGYGSASGSGVITGSQNGGAPFPAVAGITATFAAPVGQVEWFMSDTGPLASYTMTAYGAGDVVLETIASATTLPPGYSGGSRPPPGTTPLPGLYWGFNRPQSDIVRISIDSADDGDAFAIDDVRFAAVAEPVPEPGTLLLLGAGLAGLGARAIRRRR
jgi:hypothetical protein